MMGTESARSLYCMGCGEEVPIYNVEVAGRIEVRCSCCGFALQTVPIGVDRALECIVLADDELLFRTLLTDLLLEEQVGREVVACESGPALLTEYVRRIRAGKPISLVVLDIVMPTMDGTSSGLALRAVEKGFGLPPVPILFLSGLRADEALRKAMERCVPALYLNKGKDAAPPRLARRLKELIPQLLASLRPR
jgi:CheY-like chemotaxis protein